MANQGDPTAGGGAATGVPHVALRAEDGRTYAIPVAQMEAYRLSDEEQAELETPTGASGDVRGFATGPHGEYQGTFQSWVMLMYPGTGPNSGRRRQGATAAINDNRESPTGYHPPLR